MSQFKLSDLWAFAQANPTFSAGSQGETSESAKLGSQLCALQQRAYLREIDMLETPSLLSDIFQHQMRKKRQEPKSLVSTLHLDDYRNLLQSPSTWMGRSVLGLRGKEQSKKQGSARCVVENSPYTSNLRNRWLHLLTHHSSMTLEELRRDIRAYEQQKQFADAASCHFEIVGWQRELYGDIDGGHFVSAIDGYLTCVEKIRPISRQAHAKNELRFFVKLINLSNHCASGLQPEHAHVAAQAILKKALQEERLVKLIGRCLCHKKDLTEDSARHVLTVWSYILHHHAKPAATTQAQNNALMIIQEEIKALQTAYQYPLPQPIEPMPHGDTVLNEKLLVDVTAPVPPADPVPGIEEFIDSVRARANRTSRQAGALKTSSSLLLIGPTGTGKTEAVKFVAHRLYALLVKVRAVDIKTMWYGESEKTLKAIFEQVKAHATSKKAPRIVLMFDEIDGLASCRSNFLEQNARGGDRDVLTSLLNLIGPTELEYLYHADDESIRLGEVVIVATTNNVRRVDNALLSRFQSRLHMPRWTPQQNLSLLARLTSAGTDLQQTGLVSALFTPDAARSSVGSVNLVDSMTSPAKGMRTVTTLLSSRLQLREVCEAAESAVYECRETALISQQQKAWRVVCELRQRREAASTADGLVANSQYELLSGPPSASFEEADTRRSGPISAFRISMNGLLSLNEGDLDLDKHPYVILFELKRRSCALVVNKSGIAFAILESSVSPDESLGLALLGCYPGHSHHVNKKAMQQLDEPSEQLIVCYGLDSEDNLEYDLGVDKSPMYVLPESGYFSDAVTSEVSTVCMPIFLWSEIVEGAMTFRDAKRHLTSYNTGKAEMSVELFVKLNAAEMQR